MQTLTLENVLHEEKNVDAVEIRFANNKDIFGIAKLYNNNFKEHTLVQLGYLNNPEYLAARISNTDERWAVAKFNDDVIGVAGLAIAKPVGLAEIERVCVDSRFRGNNVSYGLCSLLLDEAKSFNIGFVEAFARGDNPAMQRVLKKLGFKVYGIAPRFEASYGDKLIRLQFVHMGIELKPGTVTKNVDLIPEARRLYDCIKNGY